MVHMLPTYSKFCAMARKAKKLEPLKDITILALDPGETTGWAVFTVVNGNVQLDAAGQISTWPMENAVTNFNYLYDTFIIDHTVHELYAVYEWKAQDHSWSQVPTLRVIGCLETICILKDQVYSSQTAQIAKNFCTDEKLKGWGLWIPGQRHARDAIRHACYWLAFNGQ